MNPYQEEYDNSSGSWDQLDLDTFIKVASHTIFSPFFTFFIPFLYKSAGAPWSDPTFLGFSAWFTVMASICKSSLDGTDSES